ncbi:hypothetical protein [Actinomadura decatromicini]|uniref:Secreted protein n=1 Tax=Actinomadura decatromicini TaxID=2604572 RepID=A0A5D3FX25_9ACTN|nr:hypothetical protein [Actinomadura decatromicini]TYK53397.1 hypothetical protein FXF68_06760 [Actinomadura decatromicini]
MRKRPATPRAALLVAVGATAMALAPASPATAATPTRAAIGHLRQAPAYTCDRVDRSGPGSLAPYTGSGNCQASGGLPQQGPLFDEFDILDRHGGGQSVHCSTGSGFSGYANLPDTVEGNYCTPVNA